mmetsp:Transcript_68847/g.224298  ORF Transcript_68847/g.224298 Transcript_68847/m.224298 type:complete len:266 (+) Transcript_68847:21-818(+)
MTRPNTMSEVGRRSSRGQRKRRQRRRGALAAARGGQPSAARGGPVEGRGGAASGGRSRRRRLRGEAPCRGHVAATAGRFQLLDALLRGFQLLVLDLDLLLLFLEQANGAILLPLLFQADLGLVVVVALPKQLEIRNSHLLLLLTQGFSQRVDLPLVILQDALRGAGLAAGPALKIDHHPGELVLLCLQPSDLTLPPVGQFLRVLLLFLGLQGTNLAFLHVQLDALDLLGELPLLLVHDPLHALQLFSLVLARFLEVLLPMCSFGR